LKYLVIIIKVIGYSWLTLAVLLIFASLIMIWKEDGFAKVQEIFNPFNFWNTIVVVIVLAPGVVLLVLSEHLKSKIKI
jgi:hypothetical protein